MSAVIKSGKLTLLGESSTNDQEGRRWKYTVIELDGRPALFNCLISSVLNNYLNRSLGQHVTLYCSPDEYEIEIIRAEDGILYTPYDPVQNSKFINRVSGLSGGLGLISD